MEKSKLIALLKSLNSRELRELKDFVASPFFNKNKELLNFYLYLKKQAPKFAARHIDRRKAFAQLYPDRPFDEKQMHYLMSFLLKLAEQYLGWQHYTKQLIQPQCDILSELSDRKLDKHYHFVLTTTQKKLMAAPQKDVAWYQQQYSLADISYQQFLRKNVRRYDTSLQQAADQLDEYYLLNKLKYSCEMLSQQKAIAVHYHQPLVKQLIAYLNQHPSPKPLIAIYYHLLQLQLHADETHYFDALKSLIYQHADHIQPQELAGIYIHAANYCVQKIRAGHTHFGDETLALYVDGIEREALFEKGFLNPWIYKNVVKLGLSLRRYDWTETFIHQYTPMLEAEFRADALHYNLAELCYYRRQYDAALEHIHQVQYSDIHYNLGARKLFLKIYYEQGAEEALLSQLAAFNIFLKRNKLIPTNVKAPYKHFNQLLADLMKRNKRSMVGLADKIQNTNPLTDRPWLMQKYEALKKYTQNKMV